MSKSKIEELLAGVYLCAGLLAFNLGWWMLGIPLLFKAALDTICAILSAIAEFRKGDES